MGEAKLGNVTRLGLEKMVLMARINNAVMVFESTDRILRATDFHPVTNPCPKLTRNDFNQLSMMLGFIMML